MRLLITGGAGCLGSVIANHFADVAESVVVLDNLSSGSEAWLETSETLFLELGDVRDKDFVGRVFDEYSPTHVIHAAASYQDPDDWEGDLAVNGLGTLNIVRSSEIAGVDSLVYLQTALVYGNASHSPISAEALAEPFTSYGISKLVGERYVLAGATPVSVSLRLANVCAPRLSIGPIPAFYRKILAGEECQATPAVRDFLHVADFISLVQRVLQYDGRIRGAFNVSTGVGVSVSDVFQLMTGLLGGNSLLRQLPLAADDVAEVVLDSSKTESCFGWTPAKSLRDTVADQVNWYRVHGVDQKASHLRHDQIPDVDSRYSRK